MFVTVPAFDLQKFVINSFSWKAQVDARLFYGINRDRRCTIFSEILQKSSQYSKEFRRSCLDQMVEKRINACLVLSFPYNSGLSLEDSLCSFHVSARSYFLQNIEKFSDNR